MSYLPRSAIIAAVLIGASSPAPYEPPPSVAQFDAPPYQGHARARSSWHTKSYKKRPKKLEAKLRKQGRKNARRR